MSFPIPLTDYDLEEPFEPVYSTGCELDTGLLFELLAHEPQAAQELSQRQMRSVVDKTI